MAEVVEQPPDWAYVRVRSVGVDVGSATSHLVFSEITMVKRDQRFVPAERRVTHRSPILFTPYLSGTTIDVDVLVAFIDAQFAAAGMARQDVGCGAVILTGTALDRANARLAADLLAGHAGRFVAVSAGDALESVLAAHGSGTVARSAAASTPVLNIDIGGGTTKLALCERGGVVATAALDVGSRLIVTDEHDRVVRLEEAGRRIAERLGMAVAPGTYLDHAARDAIAAHLIGEVICAARLGGEPRGASWLLRTAPLPASAPVVVVSGGVAEYLTGHGAVSPGDLGPALGGHLAAALAAAPEISVLPARDAIRATALGAALFTVQLSGDTVYLSRPAVLPLRDVPVAVTEPIAAEVDPARIAAQVRLAAERLGAGDGPGGLAVAVRWTGSATPPRLAAVARGVVDGTAAAGVTGPLVLVCDDDVGRLLGRHVAGLLPDARDVVSVDGVDLRDLDFIDIGEPAGRSRALPVTVKSLVFAPEPAPPAGG